MQISHLSLTNFRNYARLEMPFPPGITVLYGDNAQGKTSLLEAIYYLATSRSPYATSDQQLINHMTLDEALPFARLVAEVETAEGIQRIEVTVLGEGNLRPGRRLRKEIRINGLPRRVMDLLGQMRVVLFLPQDLVLVEGPPGERRRYLNITLCQTDPAYCRALSQYDRVLTQRNALLRQLQEQRSRPADPSELAFWDEQLARNGAVLVAGRYRLIQELERRAQRIHSELSAGSEHLRLRYLPGLDATAGPGGQMAFAAADLGAAALPQLPADVIAQRFLDDLQRLRRDDLARGLTTIGPQRDEIRFVVNGHDLGLYGSRGQSRTAVLALKLAELEWIQAASGEPPILLLDEVTAELDPRRRSYLLERLGDVRQALLTTAEPELLDPELLRNAARWEVTAGTIRPAGEAE